MGGDNQPRREGHQELEGVLPPSRCNFVGVSERTAGRGCQTRRRRRSGDYFLKSRYVKEDVLVLEALLSRVN